MGGKSVETSSITMHGIATKEYVCGGAEVVFLVETSSDALAAEALSRLP